MNKVKKIEYPLIVGIMLITILLACPDVNATNRYVATTGDDGAAGTIGAPWATWGKAFTSTDVHAGDTVFFRGGVYELPEDATTGYDVTRSGTVNNWIVFMNYPGEVPILDCGHADPGAGQYNIGVSVNGYSYIKFKGLTVRNILQVQTNHMVWTRGFEINNGFITFENCTVYDSQGVGFMSYFYYGWENVNGTHTFINCDAYNCSNPEVIEGYLPGNAGTGFSSQNFYGTEGFAYIRGCRAWFCGDQGFSWNGDNYCQVDSCWSFNNGQLQGDGHGFKLGWHDRDYGSPNPVVRNCIAAYNRSSGMTTNDNGLDVAEPMSIYNNTIYKNDGYGIVVYNTTDIDADELKRDFKNNICYANVTGEIFTGPSASYTHTYNSWDDPPDVTLSDADFVSVDSTGISGARQANGNLPVINFLRLAASSDCIDAGTYVGLPKIGDGYDLGAFEYGATEEEPPAEPGEPGEVLRHNGKTVRYNGKTVIQ